MTRKIVWGTGDRNDPKDTKHREWAKGCASTEYKEYCLWVERLDRDYCERWVWIIEGAGDGAGRTVAAGVVDTETEARKAAEKAARALARPRLKLVTRRLTGRKNGSSLFS